MKLKFKGNLYGSEILWQCAFHSFPDKSRYWGHSTVTGIPPRLTLNSGYLKEDLTLCHQSTAWKLIWN